MNTNWTRFNKYLYKYWKLQTAVILLGIVVLPLGLFNPYLTKLVIDKAYGNRDVRLFFILAIIGGSIFVLNGLINFFSGYLSKHINRRVYFDITKDLFRHLQRLHLNFFDNHSTGEHIYRIDSDVRHVSDFVSNTIPQIVTLFPRVLFILIIIFYLNWKLALLAILLVPISYIQPYFFGKWLREITRHMIEKSQDIFERLQEIFSHMHVIKALGREDYEIERFTKNLTKRVDFELNNARVWSLSGFFSSVINRTIGGIIALYGGYQVIKGTMTLGSLTAVMIYLTQLLGLTKSIGRFYETTIVNSVSRQRLAEIFDINPGIQDVESAVDYRILRGEIEFKDVYFGYNKDKLILKGMNFSIAPRSKIALVGPSGCGKTTLISLILRLYEPKKGSILIDGLSIRDFKLKSLKGQIGIALQEPFLWNDTVRRNILYGTENAGTEEMVKAAELAQMHNFILNLPRQYDSVIGEMACKISEGQKERIAIARALIKKPKILILDEAMSSLDSETEDKIIDNIKHEFKDSILIIIAHRLSTVKKMDLVYFIEGRSTIDIGTHGELLERKPVYRELFASQLEKFTQNGILI